MQGPHDPSSPLPAPATPLASVRVSAIQVRALVEALETTGVQAETLFADCGLDGARLSDPYGWFELGEFDKLMVSAAALARDPAFGLHWGERSPMTQYDLASALLGHAPTLRAAIEYMLQFQTILADRSETTFSERGEYARLTCDPMGVSEPGRRLRGEFAVTGVYRLLVSQGGHHCIRRVAFAHDRPAHGDELERVFAGRVRFDQTYSGVEFARSALDRPRTNRNAELHVETRSQMDRLRARLLGEFTYAQQVKQRIRAALPAILTMTEAARSLETSERSLRRRLSEEQRSYSQLVDEVQRERADELLAAGNLSVKQLADAVGFDSVSGFHRAYRRWTGKTPAQARPGRARR